MVFALQLFVSPFLYQGVMRIATSIVCAQLLKTIISAYMGHRKNKILTSIIKTYQDHATFTSD